MRLRRTRKPVKLAHTDWQRIYNALARVEWPAAYGAGLTLRKIGVDGMAARDRGVAAVRRGRA